jgi:hypothetical protein
MKAARFSLALAATVTIASLAYAEENSASLSPAESNNKVITITDGGIEPKVLTMRKEDRIAFFLNNSAESLITLSVSFGKNATHCASENLKIDEDGSVRSTRPISPKDFATTCFHDPGTYSYTVFGVKSAPQGVQGTIQVR